METKKIITQISLLFILSVGMTGGVLAQSSYSVKSPDGLITLKVTAGTNLTWSVDHETTSVITPSEISLTLADGKVLGRNMRIQGKPAVKEVNTKFATPLYKKAEVIDHYNQLMINTRDNYGIEFRVYNDGAAYRLVTTMKGEITVLDEEVNFNFANDYKVFVPYVNDMRDGERWTYSFESFYSEVKLSEMVNDSIAIVPLLVDLGNGKKAAIMEGGLEDYAGMFLKINTQTRRGLLAEFAGYPLAGHFGGHNNYNFVATQRAEYIAKSDGKRTFPWKAIVISRKDVELANNDMAQKLAAPSRIADVSWIKPGKVAWDWWNDMNLTGVDFKVGQNTESYKYFIDFAAANKLEYIIIDGGWSEGGLRNVIPGLDIQQVVDYGNSKNVGVILWASWADCDKECKEVFPYYAKIGVKGFKVDFFDADDQKMIKSLFEITKVAADNKLVLDHHGMKATGIQRTYPNVLNFEGVKGLENFKWAAVVNGRIVDDAPRYDVTIPYIRMLAGPMDYTPGAMNNANRYNYRSINSTPMSQGTRVHQMAMYTIFEAPLQMLSDSPTAYMKEQECTDFIAKVPTVFDKTSVLDGQVAEYVLMAREKDGVWYVGAMTNWNARDITVDFSFLGSGTWEMDMFRDGVNSDRNGADYKREVKPVSSSSKETYRMYPGGGWTARIYRK